MESLAIVKAFEKELSLNEKGMLALKEKKSGLVFDVKSADGFKSAKKEKQEMNKTLGGIDRLAIDGKTAVDVARHDLKAKVSKIYQPIVNMFDVEDKARKAEALRLKEKETLRLKTIRDKINELRSFSLNLFGKPSSELQNIIESLDMIDISISFEELTQEAMQVKKETLGELNIALSSAIQNEKLDIQREELRLQAEKQEEQKVIDELKAKAQTRLNNLMMIPSGFFGKNSSEISKKIQSLENYEVKDEEFRDLSEQARVAKDQVVVQLANMRNQQQLVEEMQEKSAPVKHKEPIKLTSLPKVNEEITKTIGGFTTTKKLTKYESMIKQVDFWASQYGVVNSEYNDLINILKQYK